MKWTLITGAAKRLGAEICRHLAARGHNVVIQYQHSHKEALALREECLSQGYRVEIVQGDFTSLESTLDFADACLKKFPDIKFLVNNVGNYLVKPALETKCQEWVSIFQNNVHVPFFLTRAFIEPLKLNQGAIINLGIAGLSSLRADKYSPCYTAAKASLLSWTKSLALELAPDQVRVNMVSPGYLDISEDLPKDISKIPLHRAGSCAEVAEVISFLLDDKNRYITGQNIEVAGGIRL